jgi:DNA invertase Pin-like site-specific DNA recombinase
VHVVIYAARSKDETEGRDSTGDQVAGIRARVEQLGGRTVVGGPHVDHASGFRGNRGPGLEAAIAAATEAAPCEMWVYASSRLGRGTGKKGEARAIGKLLYDLRAEDVLVRSVTDDEFTTNEMLWGITSTQASKYSQDLASNIARGKKSAFEKGRWPGGPVPDGYRLVRDPDTDRRKLVADPERAPIIRPVFELRAESLGFKEIARALNAEHRTKRGGPFTAKGVRIMLANATYAGRAVLGEQTVEGEWEAIVDPDLFDLCDVKARMRKASETGRGGRKPTDFVLGSLAVCDACGSRMTGGKRGYVRKDGSQQRYYQCNASRDCLGTCTAPRLDADRIEQAVRDNLSGLFIDFDAWVAEQAEFAAGQHAAAKAELGRCRKALAKLQRQRDSVREKWLEKQTPAREDALEHCIREVKAAEERVAAAEAGLASDDRPQTDAMLDAFSALKRTLGDEAAPLNERLRRIFKEFRIGLLDEGQTIAILPVLLPDAIATHGGRPGVIGIIEGSDYTAMKDKTASADSPVLLLVPPPVRGVRVDAAKTDHLSVVP